jgi:transcriptional regulator with XRE-family HTH domain
LFIKSQALLTRAHWLNRRTSHLLAIRASYAIQSCAFSPNLFFNQYLYSWAIHRCGERDLIGNQSQLGQLFRDARKGAGLTQAELALRASIGLSAVQAVEQGRGRVSSLTAMLKTLGLELRGRQLSAGPIGPALVLARKRRKVSRRKLAKALGVSRNTLVAVETGGGLVGTLEAYAGAVGAGLYLARPDARRGFLTHAGNSTGNTLWETPVWLAKALSHAVGGFDVDSFRRDIRPAAGTGEGQDFADRG